MTNEAFSRVKIDAQLRDQGWDIANTNTVRFEARCRDVPALRVQQHQAIAKAEAAFQAPLAWGFSATGQAAMWRAQEEATA
ncbi:hypothetical protein [Inhella sp.]|uniref:hypothetical protein n=1 Tax=Inhella sp. TaxID=1921806 RepID=UPI0035AEB24F